MTWLHHEGLAKHYHAQWERRKRRRRRVDMAVFFVMALATVVLMGVSLWATGGQPR